MLLVDGLLEVEEHDIDLSSFLYTTRSTYASGSGPLDHLTSHSNRSIGLMTATPLRKIWVIQASEPCLAPAKHHHVGPFGHSTGARCHFHCVTRSRCHSCGMLRLLQKSPDLRGLARGIVHELLSCLMRSSYYLSEMRLSLCCACTSRRSGLLDHFLMLDILKLLRLCSLDFNRQKGSEENERPRRTMAGK